MKKLLEFGLLSLFALSFAGGCSKNDNALPEDNDVPKYRLSVKADKGSNDPSTKALSLENRNGKHYLAAYWETSDAIYVHNGREGGQLGILHPRDNGANVYLDGEISGNLKAGDYLCFSYPVFSFDCNYTGQDGTLEKIAKNYDYAFADTYITSINGSNIALDQLRFFSQQAIVKFTLVDAGGNPIYPTKLTLTAKDTQNADLLIISGGNTGNLEINIDQKVPHNEIFVALSLMGTTTAASFKLVASVGEQITYVYERSAETTFETEKYYEIKVKLSDMTVNPSIGINDIKFNFDFTENGSAWTKEGPIFVFFDDVTTGYYLIIRDADGWQPGEFVDLGGTQASDLLKNGTATAVFLDWGDKLDVTPVTYSNGKWKFLRGGSSTEGWKYLSANKVPCTVSAVSVGGTETISLNSSFSISEPPGNAIAIDPGLYGTYFTKLACNNLIPAGLASISSDGTVNDVDGTAGQWINVISYYGCAKLVPSPDNVYYYALHANNPSVDDPDFYYHIFDQSNTRLALVGSSYPHAVISSTGADWLQVGRDHYVTIRDKTWWSTNLSSDKVTPLPNPWTSAEFPWTTENQWNPTRYLASLSEAMFYDGSVLPEPFNWYNDNYYYHHFVNIFDIKGLILADKNDLTKFIFLPLLVNNHDDFIFYAGVGQSAEDQLMYHSNWHYWAKGFAYDLYIHAHYDDGRDDRYWGYHRTSTIHIPSYGSSFYPCYNGADLWNNVFIPDYGVVSTNNIENVQLQFPVRPVKE